MNAQGIPLRTIQRTLDQRDPRSTVRYADADVEVVRVALAKAYRRRAQDADIVGRSITSADLDMILDALKASRTAV